VDIIRVVLPAYLVTHLGSDLALCIVYILELRVPIAHRPGDEEHASREPKLALNRGLSRNPVRDHWMSDAIAFHHGRNENVIWLRGPDLVLCLSPTASRRT
jgi:hypothetical protein